MRSSLVFVHLLFVGIWLGCVLTEALFERALLGQGPAQELLLAGLHKKVDLWVEIPAFTLVLLSGAALMASAWARARLGAGHQDLLGPTGDGRQRLLRALGLAACGICAGQAMGGVSGH